MSVTLLAQKLLNVSGQIVTNRGLNKNNNKSKRDALFLKYILVKNSACFGQIYCPSSGDSTLYTQQ
jgi:hypothetical protein